MNIRSVFRTFNSKVLVSVCVLGLVASLTSPAVAEVVSQEIGHGVLDADRVLGNKWRKVHFNALKSGENTLRASWDSDATVLFSVYIKTPKQKFATTAGTSTPDEWTGVLEEGVDYFIGIWAKEGSANFTVEIEADISDPNPDPEFIVHSQVAKWGQADYENATGPRFNRVGFTPTQSGLVTVELEWSGDEIMDLVVKTAGNTEIVSDNSASGSPKVVTFDAVAGKWYPTESTIRSGTAEWAVKWSQTVPNPDFGISDAPDAATRPNIVLINTDDQRYDTLHLLPNITELLVEKGVSYTNAIVPTPSCCPSRATTLSGQYVHNNGQFQQLTDNEPIFEKTLQKYLKEEGYFTGTAGKYLHWIHRNNDLIPPYWDRWTNINGGYYSIGVNFDGVRVTPGGYTTDIVFERTKDYLRDFESLDDDAPWFVYLAPMAPHLPSTAEYDLRNEPVSEYVTSPAYLEADISDKPDFIPLRSMDDAEAREFYEKRVRSLYSVDREVKQLVEYLEASGELDNTMIIFTSDNGYILGEHQTREKFVPWRKSVEVPFIISWPGNVPENITNDSYVSAVDIAPTILEAAGVDISALDLDGRNIFDESRDAFYMEFFFDPPNSSVIGDWASIRNDTYQYTEWYGAGADADAVIFREYYDMVNDPFQLENLYENADPLDDPDYTILSAELAVQRNCVGSTCI